MLFPFDLYQITRKNKTIRLLSSSQQMTLNRPVIFYTTININPDVLPYLIVNNVEN